MNELGEGWIPEFGGIITWFAVDKYRRVAVMVNNCYGPLPRVLSRDVDLESSLDRLGEYLWGESAEFPDIPEDKNGLTILDYYSKATYRKSSRREVESTVLRCSHLSTSECSFPSSRGYFVFHAVDADRGADDCPVGYEGESQAGDYFRYLVPTVYASIDDFPAPLRKLFVVAPDVDFERDRFFEGQRLDERFLSMYSGE